ncbi:hypothetical protein QW131_33450 [Roseibium salinum]|nr:hypothetical protein [Roseibium salinum]
MSVLMVMTSPLDAFLGTFTRGFGSAMNLYLYIPAVSPVAVPASQLPDLLFAWLQMRFSRRSRRW